MCGAERQKGAQITPPEARDADDKEQLTKYLCTDTSDYTVKHRSVLMMGLVCLKIVLILTGSGGGGDP